MFNWAPTTLSSYNNIVGKLSFYCNSNNLEFPPLDSSSMAGFLVDLSNSSSRPRSILKSASAACSCLYDGLELTDNPFEQSDIRRLSIALTKTGTDNARKKTPVMPIQAFSDLFTHWQANEHLSIKQLRQKSLALLAITLMLRPSDVAPRSKVYNMDTNEMDSMLFKINQIEFNDDGSATIILHGIKNDYIRDGFEIQLDN